MYKSGIFVKYHKLNYWPAFLHEDQSVFISWCNGFITHIMKMWTNIMRDIMKFLKVLFLPCTWTLKNCKEHAYLNVWICEMSFKNMYEYLLETAGEWNAEKFMVSYRNRWKHFKMPCGQHNVKAGKELIFPLQNAYGNLIKKSNFSKT